MSLPDPLLQLLARFAEEGVEYVLIGGQAVRLNGFLRATEDIDVLLRPTRENGETYASMQPYAREIVVDSVPIRVLNIDGLLRTKTTVREKDLLDRRMLERIKSGLGAEE